MTEAEKAKRQDLVAAAVRTLIEHFDTVQILCSSMDGATTQSFVSGAGNYYARLGQCREFLIEDKARTEHDACIPPPDESDDWKAAT